MANQQHLALLKRGVDSWNQWRQEHPEIQPDLSGATLNVRDLREVDFSRTILSGAHLIWACLREARLTWADLRGADLSGADLTRADLTRAELAGACFQCANLDEAVFEGVFLEGVVLEGTSYAYGWD